MSNVAVDVRDDIIVIDAATNETIWRKDYYQFKVGKIMVGRGWWGGGGIEEFSEFGLFFNGFCIWKAAAVYEEIVQHFSKKK